MGLDMYLSKRHYVKNWDHQKPEERHTLTLKGPKANQIDLSKVNEITEDVAYWRKANAIHLWFVENIQDGEDDCREYSVSVKKLWELLDTCKKVLKASKLVKGKIKNGYTYKDGKEIPNMEDGKYIKDPSVAMDLLPTTSGFFFGSTDYDEYYLADIKNTIEQLEEALEKEPDGDYYYQSSW